MLESGGCRIGLRKRCWNYTRGDLEDINEKPRESERKNKRQKMKRKKEKDERIKLNRLLSIA